MNLGCGEIQFCACKWFAYALKWLYCCPNFNVNLVRVVTHEKHWCKLVGVWAFYHRDCLGGFYCHPCFYYVMPKGFGNCMWWQQIYVFYQKSVEPAQIANNQVIHYYTPTKTDLWVVAMLLNLLKPCKIVKWALVRRKSAS